MKKTTLFFQHLNSDAYFINFSGNMVPAWYSSVEEEYYHIRKKPYIFEHGTIGTILISGSDRDRLVNQLITKNILNIDTNETEPALLLNEDGRIVDKVNVYRLGDAIVITFHRINLPFLLKILEENPYHYAYHFQNMCEQTGKIVIQGKKISLLCEELFREKFEALAPNQCFVSAYSGYEVLVNKVPATRNRGIEILFTDEYAVELWEQILEWGKPYGIKPCGYFAEDIARVERGNPSYFRELRGNYPDEVGLSYLIDETKPTFLGKEGLLKYRANPSTKRIYYLTVEGIEYPSRGSIITDMYQESIGYLTDCLYSFEKQHIIGIGLLDSTKVSNEMNIMIQCDANRIVLGKTYSEPFLSPAD